MYNCSTLAALTRFRLITAVCLLFFVRLTFVKSFGSRVWRVGSVTLRPCCAFFAGARLTLYTIGEITIKTGEDWSPTFRLGDQPPVCWSPNFLAVVFKKQEISLQVVTRMQNLAYEFWKIFRGWYPRTITAGGGDPLSHRTPSPAFGRARSRKRPGVGTQTLVPLNFSAVVAPLPCTFLRNFLIYVFKIKCWHEPPFMHHEITFSLCCHQFGDGVCLRASWHSFATTLHIFMQFELHILTYLFTCCQYGEDVCTNRACK